MTTRHAVSALAGLTFSSQMDSHRRAHRHELTPPVTNAFMVQVWHVPSDKSRDLLEHRAGHLRASALCPQSATLRSTVVIPTGSSPWRCMAVVRGGAPTPAGRQAGQRIANDQGAAAGSAEVKRRGDHRRDLGQGWSLRDVRHRVLLRHPAALSGGGTTDRLNTRMSLSVTPGRLQNAPQGQMRTPCHRPTTTRVVPRDS